MNRTRDLISKILFCVILLGILIFVGYFIYLHTLTVVEINSIGCRELFGCSVAEFMNTDLALYEETGDLRKYALVDQYKTGTILRFSFPSSVCKRILQSDWIRAVDEIRDVPEIVLSEDYKTVTVTVKAEEADAFFETHEQRLETILTKALLARHLQGVEEGRNYVTLKLVDADSGEVIDTQNSYFSN